jgi:hypothetical protein
MSHPVTGIDHCYLLVEDLDRSQSQFQRLGFTVSPRGFHTAAMGSANHTIMFPNDYFELLGLVAETPENEDKRDLLQRHGEGLHAVACRSDNVAEAASRLKELGIGTSGQRSFERPVTLPDGGTAIAAFSVLSFNVEEVPVGTAFMCQHHTPETVWLPALLVHRNGAKGLAGLVAGTQDPRRSADGYARLFAAGSICEVPGGWQVATGSAPITFLSWPALADRYAGIEISRTPKTGFAALQILVDSLDTVRGVLGQEGIAVRSTDRGLAVGPGDASGAVVEFVVS